ncbi:hypothetical protein SAY87_027364 [Trapa incisa]|uniref:DUF7148 domain-containing protein n=1 Tax=Trapa incisa TaxID=236973 RepID=A0AAN7GN90_9MYRT|nr:hypothetical protein SAY87_027364 [Trapa incisa]
MAGTQLLTLRSSGIQVDPHQMPLLLPNRAPHFRVSVGAGWDNCDPRHLKISCCRRRLHSLSTKVSSDGDGVVPFSEDDDGVSLGTMKLPPDTDLPRFETLLFQWANSLCQGANLPLPVPLKVSAFLMTLLYGQKCNFCSSVSHGINEVLKFDGSSPAAGLVIAYFLFVTIQQVDKIPGGARLGFITIEDGKTEVLVYIDCQVFPPTDGANPMFRAMRNGPSKDQPPPGEPRIMRSLLGALQKSVAIARL